MILNHLLGLLTLHLAFAQDCVLDDVQKTKGQCLLFSECPFAIEYFKAGVRPKICSGRVVCCPTEKTMAEKKCLEWRSHLAAPVNGLAVSSQSAEPFCQDLGATGFIKGGRNARLYEFPHAAALGYDTPDGHRYYCGGTIISDEWIVTAGHCLASAKGKPSVILVADITLDRNISSFRRVVGISDWVIHPDYHPPLKYNDIALIKSKETLEINRWLLPACLPDPGQIHSDSVTAVGWGTLAFGEPQSNILQAVNLTAFGNKDCNNYYADASDKTWSFPQGIVRSQICAGDKTLSGKDTCNGDSGGPLTVSDVLKNKELRCLFRLIGITSFGARLCGQNSPAVYTRVQSFVPWIESIVFKNSEPTEEK